MNQIVVPQFLDVEDKIIGAVTVRQFLEMIVGGMFIFIFYKIFDFSLFVVLSLITISLVLLFAFIKINGQKFHYFLLNLISTIRNPKLKVWHKRIEIVRVKRGKEKMIKDQITTLRQTKPLVSSSRLSELSLVVDTGGVYRGENSDLN